MGALKVLASWLAASVLQLLLLLLLLLLPLGPPPAPPPFALRPAGCCTCCCCCCCCCCNRLMVSPTSLRSGLGLFLVGKVCSREPPAERSSLSLELRHFIRLFWNQILTCESRSPNFSASFLRSGLLIYFCNWNLFSSPTLWLSEKTARRIIPRRGLPRAATVHGKAAAAAAAAAAARSPKPLWAWPAGGPLTNVGCACGCCCGSIFGACATRAASPSMARGSAFEVGVALAGKP